LDGLLSLIDLGELRVEVEEQAIELGAGLGIPRTVAVDRRGFCRFGEGGLVSAALVEREPQRDGRRSREEDCPSDPNAAPHCTDWIVAFST
jgi:hypothetical protein